MFVDAHAHCDRYGDRTDQAIAQMNLLLRAAYGKTP